jgi:dimethylglycine dehydrogenase
VPKEIADQPDGWQIELLGDMLDARLQIDPLFDANGGIMRG